MELKNCHEPGYSASNMTGSVNSTVTLPCTYSASNVVTGVCWGRGRCSTFRCSDAIIRSNSSRVIRQSYRYELLGKVPQGVASLTITSLTVEDEGTYCCKVYIQGPSNDVRREINLQIVTSKENFNVFQQVYYFHNPPYHKSSSSAVHIRERRVVTYNPIDQKKLENVLNAILTS
ncbi:unnamed protein product [Ranitomeya imitator]|uniref:Ig-like domain-containing protein n=1 Tax=Ranitomeya imitator TaxID=111125 RepID=A0ABN9M547_9NEOB|nr:unnamed protein product [Ranitomeya imitator]